MDVPTGVNNLQGANCADLPEADKEMFFAKGGTRAVADAKLICRYCPVLEACLSDVLAWEFDRERHGVFGGMTGAERQDEFGGTGRKRPKMCQSGLHEMTPGNTSSTGHARCIACQRDFVRNGEGNRKPTACGTYQGYKTGCRCDRCRAANAERGREQRAARKARPTPEYAHGTVKGYGTHECRCAECRSAWKLARRNRRVLDRFEKVG